MLKNGNTQELVQLLGSYRRVSFPSGPAAERLAGIEKTIHHNCGVSIQFADRMLRNAQEDGEECFCLHSLRQEALALKRACAAASRPAAKAAENKVVTLRSKYDTFIGSVKHLFFLLDRDLAERVDGVL